MGIQNSVQVGARHHEGRDRFQAFAVSVSADTDLSSLLQTLVTEYRLKKATHLSWAVRLEENNSILEKKNDGGESGSSNCILDILRKKDVKNTFVLVARWFGGKHLGGLRFRIYRSLTDKIT